MGSGLGFSHASGIINITGSNKKGNMNAFIYGQSTGSRFSGTKKKRRIKGMRKN